MKSQSGAPHSGRRPLAWRILFSCFTCSQPPTPSHILIHRHVSTYAIYNIYHERLGRFNVALSSMLHAFKCYVLGKESCLKGWEHCGQHRIFSAYSNGGCHGVQCAISAGCHFKSVYCVPTLAPSPCGRRCCLRPASHQLLTVSVQSDLP